MNNKIQFTDSAKNEINRILLNKSPKTYFRISVQGGGCSGFKYNFKFDEKVDKNDNIFMTGPVSEIKKINLKL